MHRVINSPGVVKAFHLIAFTTFAFTIFYFKRYLDIPQPYPRHRLYGRAKYASHWNLTLLCFIFCLSCVIDWAPIPFKGQLCHLRDHIFLSVSLPSCVFVPTFFWSMYHVDRELIFPRCLELYYPTWLNHLIHTAILPFALLEAMLCRHRQPSRKGAFITLFAYVSCYVTWLNYLGIVHSVWVYPVFEVLSTTGTIAFITSGSVVIFIFYICLEKVNILWWAHQGMRLDVHTR
ncbi:androgen-dependent TFPI-regulating protein-like [Ornithodoros turicata]|uniref:androgen-dependent TFPI-regulating protein-like n=1 Tax=Ornithodoros turicata TaxID=34597 RepID=UPI0031398F46